MGTLFSVGALKSASETGFKSHVRAWQDHKRKIVSHSCVEFRYECKFCLG